jgi:hypothetical protein
MAENSRRKGKRSSRRLLTAAQPLSAAVALAGPTGGQIVAGSGGISHSGNTTTIEKSSPDTHTDFAMLQHHSAAEGRFCATLIQLDRDQPHFG